MATNSSVDFEKMMASAYQAPGESALLDLSFMYEGSVPHAINPDKTQARINAALIASSTNRATKNPVDIYNTEYRVLEGLSVDEQRNYVDLRIREESLEAMGAEYDRYLAAFSANLVGPEVTQSPSEEAEASVISNERGFLPQRLFADLPEVSQRGTSMDLVATVNSSDNGTANARAERMARNQMLMDALQRSGYDMESFAPWNSGSVREALSKSWMWTKEFLPLSFTHETQTYDIGALDIAKIQKMTPKQRLANLQQELDKAVANGASALVLVDIEHAHSAEASPALTGLFQGLDLLDAIFFVPKTAARTWRLWRKGRILRQYSNPVGVANAIGAPDIAARLSAAVLTERGSAMADAVKGLDKTTAAMNASPIPFVKLDPAVTAGLSHRIQTYIEDHRKLIHFYLSKAVNQYSMETSGFLRPGEREAARAQIISALPETTEVVESTPFGLGVKVTIPNPDKFATAEDLALAERRFDTWKGEYERAMDALDRAYSEARSGLGDIDSEWINRLERAKDKAKAEMDAAHKIYTKGLKEDRVLTSFIWYNRDRHTGQIMGVMEANPLWTKVVSPNSYLRMIDELLVPERTEILARQERLGVLFKKVVDEAMYNLSKKDMEKVSAILSYGSDNSRTFTARELMDGLDIPGFGTITLNKKQVAGYFKVRDMMDAAWGMRSVMKYKELGFKGFVKQTMIGIPFKSETGEILFGQKRVFVKDAGFRKLADGTTTVVLPDADLILDATKARGEGAVTSIKDAAGLAVKEKVLKGEAVLVQFSEPIRIDKHMLNYGLVSTKRLKELSPDVLGKRIGYVPNIYKVPYAVRASVKKLFDGRDEKDVFETVRFFNTRREGEAWIAAQTDGVDYIVDGSREWISRDPTYRAEINDAAFSGLYEDYRGAKIPFGPNGADAPRESAFAAVDRYMDNLAWTYPLNDWREGVLARYFNTVDEFLETPGSLESKFKAGLSADQQNAIIALRTWVQDQLSIVSGDEMIFTRWMQKSAEHMEDSTFWQKVRKYVPGGEPLSEAVRLKLLYGAENVDAYGWMRTAAFRTYLGFFNLSQLPVQASNMAVIFSLHPMNAPTVARRFLALRTVAFLNPADPSYEKIVRIAAKTAFMKYDEFEPMVRAWHQSGWAYTTRSSADARAAMRGLSPGGEIAKTMHAIDKFGMLPFTEGELWSRLYGFLDSFTRMDRQARKAGQIVDWTRPDKINELIREATRVAFNYTTANRAWWQKGITSIPTQFLQVPAKFYEELMLPLIGGKHFKSQYTKMERVRMILGQAFLFGALGIPFGAYMKNAVYKWFTEEGENGALMPGISEDQVAAITGGFTDWASAELLELATDSDVHPMISSRVALANGFDMLISNLTSGPEGWGRAALGAFGGALKGQGEPAILMVARVHDTKLGAGTFEGEDAWRILSGLAQMVKSWDNVQTARLWDAYRAVLSEQGERLVEIDPEGEDRMLICLKMVGIDSYERYTAAKLRQWNEKNNPEKEIKRALDAAKSIFMMYIKEGTLSDPETAKKWSQELYFLRETLQSEEDKDKFGAQWSKMVQDEETLLGKEYKKYLNAYIEYSGNVLAAPPLEAAFVEGHMNTERANP